MIKYDKVLFLAVPQAGTLPVELRILHCIDHVAALLGFEAAGAWAEEGSTRAERKQVIRVI